MKYFDKMECNNYSANLSLMHLILGKMFLEGATSDIKIIVGFYKENAYGISYK